MGIASRRGVPTRRRYFDNSRKRIIRGKSDTHPISRFSLALVESLMRVVFLSLADFPRYRIISVEESTSYYSGCRFAMILSGAAVLKESISRHSALSRLNLAVGLLSVTRKIV